MQKAVLVNSTIDTPRLRQRTDSGWFSRLLRHPARKRSGQRVRPCGATLPNVEILNVKVKILSYDFRLFG